jgi:hypothetical protein
MIEIRNPLRWRSPRALAAPLAAATLVGLIACGDDPFELRWSADPDTVLLFSLARPELNLPSAFSFNPRNPVQIESPGATGNWDVALDTQGSELVLLPPGALGINSRARIAALPGLDFDDVREAPSDTAAYVSDRAVPLALGTIYVVQTRNVSSQFGNCVYYAKLEPLTIAIEEGTLEFMYDSNPVCNDPRLVPPEG